MIAKICCANCDYFGIDIRNGKAVCCCSEVQFYDRHIIDVEHDFCGQFRNSDWMKVVERSERV